MPFVIDFYFGLFVLSMHGKWPYKAISFFAPNRTAYELLSIGNWLYIARITMAIPTHPMHPAPAARMSGLAASINRAYKGLGHLEPLSQVRC
jgi:hypothetical protein